jgi:hypothetical protein
MTPIAQRVVALAITCSATVVPAVAAQQPTPTTPPRPGGQPGALAQTPPAPVSGVLFGNFQYHTEAGAAESNNTDRFDVDRVYLTVRLPAGDRASVRATADLFKSTTTGYDLRFKYAYLQYDYVKPRAAGGALAALARAGILHTVVIDHEENFWPRWVAQVATERARFFSSADVGVGSVLTLPNALGEVYGTVTNGPGYVDAGSDDRFKDYALRVSLTPLGRRHGLLRTLTISPWAYKGDTASKYVGSVSDPATGTLGPIARGLTRDRWGVFAGVRDPRLVIGADYAERTDEAESGDNTSASPVAVSSATGSVVSLYTIVKPFLIADSTTSVPLGVLLRWDRAKPDKDADASTTFVVAGLTWDLTTRAGVAVDYQQQLSHDGATAPASKVYFAHFVANF